MGPQAGVDAAQRLRQPPGLHLVVADGQQEVGRRQAGVEPDGLLQRVDGLVPPAPGEPLAADQEMVQGRDRGPAGGQLFLPRPAVGVAEPGQERGASQVVGGGRIVGSQPRRAVEDLQSRGRLDGPGEDQQQVVTPLDDRPLLDVRQRTGQFAGQGPALGRPSAVSRSRPTAPRGPRPGTARGPPPGSARTRRRRAGPGPAGRRTGRTALARYAPAPRGPGDPAPCRASPRPLRGMRSSGPPGPGSATCLPA